MVSKSSKDYLKQRLRLMTEDKQNILDSICYTDLVYERINKKLQVQFSRKQAEKFVFKILSETDLRFFVRLGKNIYVANDDHRIRITINSNTMRIITVDKLVSKM